MAFQRRLFQTTVPSSPRLSSVLLQIGGTLAMSPAAPIIRKAMVTVNGALKTVKEILRQDDIFLALLSYRSTPIPDLGASPAMGRKLRTTMPSLPSTLQPRFISHKEVQEREAVMKQCQKEDYDRRHRMQPLPELSPGDPVLIKMDGEKGWKLPGEVVRKCAPRSFLVQTPRDHLRQNRQHLKQIPPSACNPDDLHHQKSGAVFSPDHTVRQEPYPTASSDQQPGVYLAGQPGTPVTVSKLVFYAQSTDMGRYTSILIICTA